MTRIKATWWVGLFWLILGTAARVSQAATWETHDAAGQEAYQRGDYAEAEKQLTAAVKEAEEFARPDPRLARSLNNLALLYQAQGRHAEAEPLHKRALAIREKVLGSEHPDVAESYNNLAQLYQAQGRFAEAEPFHRRALAIWERALGPEHPDVAQSLENYAALLRKTGREGKAEELEIRANSIRTKHAQEEGSRI